MKQNEKVLHYLREKRSVRPLEALDVLGIYRLGARIFDLRELGHEIINTEPNGKPACYVLIKEAGHA